jgi:Family of unknown function (DUF6069)
MVFSPDQQRQDPTFPRSSRSELPRPHSMNAMKRNETSAMSPSAPPTKFLGPSFLRLDLPRLTGQPRAWRWVVGTVVAVGASLLACFVLAQLAIALDPTLSGYEHFQFSDYSRLTIIGVVIACLGWPFVAWFTTSARRLYLWLAIIVVVATLAPDVLILNEGQPANGVLTLALMHFALAFITFPAMVFIAPQRKTPAQDANA